MSAPPAHVRAEIAAQLEELRRTLGIGSLEFDELTVGEVLSRLYGKPPTKRTHTRRDLAEVIDHVDVAGALLILENLYELGPACIDWTDDAGLGTPELGERDRADDERQTAGEERGS